MVILSAAQQQHRSRISYACGLLALVGVATALVVMRDPAHSSTELATPVPVPASEFPPTPTEAEPTTAPPGAGPEGDLPFDPVPVDPGAGAPPAADSHAAGSIPDPRDGDSEQGIGGGTATVASDRNDQAEPPSAVRPGPDRAASAEPHRSLLWSGLLGLSISLTGLVMVGRRRRMW